MAVTQPRHLRKAGSVAAGSFTGTPRIAAVVFAAAFPDANYEIGISGADPRSWSWESKTAAGFTINTNANLALTGAVNWTATYDGETT